MCTRCAAMATLNPSIAHDDGRSLPHCRDATIEVHRGGQSRSAAADCEVAEAAVRSAGSCMVSGQGGYSCRQGLRIHPQFGGQPPARLMA